MDTARWAFPALFIEYWPSPIPASASIGRVTKAVSLVEVDGKTKPQPEPKIVERDSTARGTTATKRLNQALDYRCARTVFMIDCPSTGR